MENIDWSVVVLQVVTCWIFYKLGQASVIRALTKDLLKLLEEKGIQLDRNEDGTVEIHKDETMLEIERVDNQYFAYSTQGQFLSQGNNFGTLFRSLKQQYPDSNFRINKNQKNLSDDEVGQMVKTIFEVFGEKAESNGQNR